jgi:CRISPR-associated protein Cmr4
LHAGTGQAVGVIDLPIARMRSTGIPIVPGSSIKGVLRAFQEVTRPEGREELLAVFGPAPSHAAEHAGALVVGDARLLALPVRSFKGTFVWVSSPLLLELAGRDLDGTPGAPQTIPEVEKQQAAVGSLDEATGSLNVHVTKKETTLFLEDLDFSASAAPEVAAWADFLARFVAPSGRSSMFSRRFAVVSDEAMTFLWQTATQIDTRVRIDADRRTVAKGALWTEESLPPETLLIGLAAAEDARRSRGQADSLTAAKVLELALAEEAILQFGGKATVGRGRCRMVPLPVANGGAR